MAKLYSNRARSKASFTNQVYSTVRGVFNCCDLQSEPQGHPQKRFSGVESVGAGMNLERKQRIEEMHDSLVVFGKDGKAEGVLDPLPGQMSFEDIMGITSDSELDERIQAQLPKDVQAFKKPPYPKNESKKIELKRLVLARLMGFSIRGKNIQDTFDFDDPRKSAEGAVIDRLLEKRLTRMTTQECRSRIRAVWSKIAREAGALVLSPENQKIMDAITQALEERKLQPSPPLTQLDILNIYNLPRHDTSEHVADTGEARWDIGSLLRLYFVCLIADDFSWDKVARRLNTKADGLAVSSTFNSQIGERGKEILRKAKGYSVLKSKKRS